jgi:hypothetical protein
MVKPPQFQAMKTVQGYWVICELKRMDPMAGYGMIGPLRVKAISPVYAEYEPLMRIRYTSEEFALNVTDELNDLHTGDSSAQNQDHARNYGLGK